MISENVVLDTYEYRTAVREYLRVFRRDAKDVVNQFTHDIVVDMFKRLPPYSLHQARSNIQGYLWTAYPDRVVRRTLGKFAGKFKKVKRSKSKAARKQLYRVHLITQAWWKKQGNKGLYGNDMRQVAAYFARRASASVGYLKSVLVPVIKELTTIARWRKVSWTGLSKGIMRWPQTRGRGVVSLAKPGPSPEATVDLRWYLTGSQAETSIMVAFQEAVHFKLAEVERETARRLEAAAKRFNGR